MRIAICEKNFMDAEMIEECCRNYFKSSGGKCKIDCYTSTVEFVEKRKIMMFVSCSCNAGNERHRIKRIYGTNGSIQYIYYISDWL